MQTIRYSTDQFTYDRETMNFIAEASTLSMGGQQPLFGQVFPDACDEGCVLVSHSSGREAAFALQQELREEGEIKAWILVPTPETLRKQPYLEGVEVHVLND